MPPGRVRAVLGAQPRSSMRSRMPEWQAARPNSRLTFCASSRAAESGPLVKEAGLFLRTSRGGGIAVAPAVQSGAGGGHVRFGGEQAGPVYGDRSFRILQAFLGNEISEDETVRQLDAALAEGVEQSLRENAADWRFSKDWRFCRAADCCCVGHGCPTATPLEDFIGALVTLGAVSAWY